MPARRRGLCARDRVHRIIASATPVVSGAHVGVAVVGVAVEGVAVVGADVGADVPPGTSVNASKPTEETPHSDVNTTRRLVALVLSGAGSISPLKLPNTSPLLPSEIVRKSHHSSVENVLKTIVMGPDELMFQMHSMSSA
jgi:hypothetical protein